MPCISGDILGLGDALCLRGYLGVGGCLVSQGISNRAWGMPCVSGNILGLGGCLVSQGISKGLGDALCLRGYLRAGGCLVSQGISKGLGDALCLGGYLRDWGMPFVSGICRAWGMPFVSGICRAWRIPRGSEDALKGFVRKPIQMSYVFQLHCCTRQFGGTILQ